MAKEFENVSSFIEDDIVPMYKAKTVGAIPPSSPPKRSRSGSLMARYLPFGFLLPKKRSTTALNTSVVECDSHRAQSGPPSPSRHSSPIISPRQSNHFSLASELSSPPSEFSPDSSLRMSSEFDYEQEWDTIPEINESKLSNSLDNITTELQKLGYLMRQSDETKSSPNNIPQRSFSADFPLSNSFSFSDLSLMGRYQDTFSVLTEKVAKQLKSHLPARLRITRQLRLLYSLDQHGISFATLERQVDNKGPLLLAIKNEIGEVFGAFLSDSIKTSTSYYGSAECFLWKELESDESSQIGSVKVFHWSGKNHYFILADPEFVAIGGGEGKFGLWIDRNFELGYTSACPTFNNDPLCANNSFECIGLEIWSFN